jgi:hypothetical protein
MQPTTWRERERITLTTMNGKKELCLGRCWHDYPQGSRTSSGRRVFVLLEKKETQEEVVDSVPEKKVSSRSNT